MAVKNIGKYGRFWEMEQGGPHQKERKKVFKCTCCGGTTHPEKGWDGEPDVNNCRGDCASRADWSPGRVSNQYRDNFDRIFRKGASA